MSDLFDQAQQLEELQRDLAVQAQAKRLGGLGRPDCLVCGEPIAEQRRRAMPNAVRCIDCQERRERWNRRRGR